MFNIFKALTRTTKKPAVTRTRPKYIHLPPGEALKITLPWETIYKDGTSEKGAITLHADVLRCSKKRGVTLEYTFSFKGGTYLGSNTELP